MSDQDGDDPETGAGGGGNTPATDPNNNSDVGNDPKSSPRARTYCNFGCEKIMDV